MNTDQELKAEVERLRPLVTLYAASLKQAEQERDARDALAAQVERVAQEAQAIVRRSDWRTAANRAELESCLSRLADAPHAGPRLFPGR